MGQQKIKEYTDKETEEQKEISKIEKSIGKRNKMRKIVPLGKVYIKASYNNTIVTFTDQLGNVLACSSAGQAGFHGPKKATPYAAQAIVKRVVEKVKEKGLKDAHVFVKGVGSGREAAIRALNAQGINILSIKDVTPIPHNGCRPKKPRRV